MNLAEQFDKVLKYTINEDHDIKLRENNFGRFWNLLGEEKQIKLVKLATGLDIHHEIEKLFRFADEVEVDCIDKIDFIDWDKYVLMKHNIGKFWSILHKKQKIEFIKLANEYWKIHKYNKYEIIKKEYNKKISYNVYEIYECMNKKLKSIDLLITDTIKYINCSGNEISKLDDLPRDLVFLICSYNNIISLNCLPNNLLYLCCSRNDLIELNNLPKNLRHLDFEMTQLEYIKLPNYIEKLRCNNTFVNIILMPNMLNYIDMYEMTGEINVTLPYGVMNLWNNGIIEKYKIIIPISVKTVNGKNIM